MCDVNAQQCAAATSLIKMGAGDAGLDTAAFTAALALLTSIVELVMQTSEPVNTIISRQIPLVLNYVHAFAQFVANKFPDSVELSGKVTNLEILTKTADAIASLDDYKSSGSDPSERISKDPMYESIRRAISAQNAVGSKSRT